MHSSINTSSLSLKVGAHGSKLSQIQVWEVHRELLTFHPGIEFIPHWVTTTGDIGLNTSLRVLDKTDFLSKKLTPYNSKGEFGFRFTRLKIFLFHSLKVDLHCSDTWSGFLRCFGFSS